MDKDSLQFGLSFFSNNRIINTNRLYFQPFWPDTRNAGQTKLKVTGKDSLKFGMRLYISATDSTVDQSKFIEYIYTVKGNEYMLRYSVKFVNMADVMDPSTKYLVLNWRDNLNRLEKSTKMERMSSVADKGRRKDPEKRADKMGFIQTAVLHQYPDFG